jgi:predicted HicB family RNase H-like nuclease
MQYKGYTARVEFDQDAGILHGEVEGLRDVITFEATDVRGLEASFRASVDDYLAQCAEDGVEPERPYSGKFLLRVDPRLHRDIAMAAARAGRSLNAFASDVFRYWIRHERPSGGVAEPVVARPAAANAIDTPDVSLYAAPADLVAVWRSGARDTPGSITPNTPPASRTPGKQAKRRAA